MDSNIEECIKELRKCKDDPIYFYSNYLMVQSIDGQMNVPKKLTEQEKQFLRDVCTKPGYFK